MANHPAGELRPDPWHAVPFMTAALPVRISPVVVYFLLLPLFGVGCARFYGQRCDSFITRTPLAADEYLASGFLGGLEAWNSESQGGRPWNCGQEIFPESMWRRSKTGSGRWCRN